MSYNVPKAYGDVLAGGPVDVAGFFRKPLVLCRLLGVLLSIVVFSTASSGGWHHDMCLLDRKSSNCNYVVFVGVTAMLCCLGLLITDFAMPHISSIQSRKVIVISDIALACLYTLLWLVCTGVIVGEWWKTPFSDLRGVEFWKFNCIQASASFSIFSLADWILITFFSTKRFNSGKTELFSTSQSGNFADNRNFDSIHGGAGSVASGGADNAQFSSQPFSAKSQIGDNPYSNKNTVVY